MTRTGIDVENRICGRCAEPFVAQATDPLDALCPACLKDHRAMDEIEQADDEEQWPRG